MRTFIAINFDKTVKKYISGIKNVVKENSKSGNFTDEENYHLTVRFIGESDEDDIEEICTAMDEACSSFKKFGLSIGGLGFFPRGNKSIVWVGMEKNKSLEILYSRLEKSLQKHGFGKNRQGLSPHITIAREVDLKKSYDWLKKEITQEKCEMTVESVSLMESVRKGSKLIYVPRYVKKLK